MKFEKIVKLLSEDMIAQMTGMDEAALSKVIVASEQAIAEAKDSLDNNEKYQELKEQVKAVSAGFRETKAYQTAKIQYALIRLTEQGK